MSRLTSLKSATSLSALASLLDFRPKAVSYLLYKVPLADKYRSFDIPKRSGGQRTIDAPNDSLKLLQRRLADLLQDCADEIVATNNRKERAAHGFKRNRSIITNARRHRHRRWVFNLDLEDFFPSINFGRVRGFFCKNRDFALHADVATVIAQIACKEHSLPQGSPCSPVISNLVAHILDMRLVKLAAGSGCTYSRYADDLTFSTNKRQMPASIAIPAPSSAGTTVHEWVPGKALQRHIERAGFRINATKTHLMYRGSRQEVTGLITNDKIGVRHEYRHDLRAMVHSLVKTGAFEIVATSARAGTDSAAMRPGTPAELHGMLGFVESIDAHNRHNAIPSSLPARPDHMTSREKTYRKFLLYWAFYAAPAPVVICEGHTDNIYLTHAIRSLAADFPDLAEILPSRKIRLRVRLYKYPRSSTARLLGLKDGGSSVLAKFLATYRKETLGFTGPGLEHPLILLYDNDKGAKSIRSAIGEAALASSTSVSPYVHVATNMYAACTPGAQPSKIEDCFDSATRATVIDGKTFSDDNGESFDATRHYGKTVFAHKVVRARADTIDFNGFRPLLTVLTAVIQRHRGQQMARVPAADRNASPNTR